MERPECCRCAGEPIFSHYALNLSAAAAGELQVLESVRREGGRAKHSGKECIDADDDGDVLFDAFADKLIDVSRVGDKHHRRSPFGKHQCRCK